MSANHNHDFNLGIDIIRAAKEAGADAIKLQTYTPDTLTIKSNKSDFMIKGSPWDGETLWDLYNSAYTPWEWHCGFKEEADRIGIELLSTPFDVSAVEFLEELGVKRYKIASFENRDAQILRAVAKTNKPIIISNGMTSVEEMELSIDYIKSLGNNDITILKCTSSYPATIDESNVSLLTDMKNRFKCSVGVSDHTPGWTVPVLSVALGGTVIEKHLTISRSIKTPDSAFSMEPDEFREMVNNVRNAELAMSSSKYGQTDGEKSSVFFRRSLFIVRDVKMGDFANEENVRSIRPGTGMSPIHYYEVMDGKYRFLDNYDAGTPLTIDKLTKGNI